MTEQVGWDRRRLQGDWGSTKFTHASAQTDLEWTEWRGDENLTAIAGLREQRSKPIAPIGEDFRKDR
jgi:hypothetical protein